MVVLEALRTLLDVQKICVTSISATQTVSTWDVPLCLMPFWVAQLYWIQLQEPYCNLGSYKSPNSLGWSHDIDIAVLCKYMLGLPPNVVKFIDTTVYKGGHVVYLTEGICANWQFWTRRNLNKLLFIVSWWGQEVIGILDGLLYGWLTGIQQSTIQCSKRKHQHVLIGWGKPLDSSGHCPLRSDATWMSVSLSHVRGATKTWATKGFL